MNNFNIYESLNPPEINFPLNSSPIDISDWAVGITDDGVPIFKQNRLPIEQYNQTESFNIPSFEFNIPSQQREQYRVNPNNQGNRKKAVEFFIDKGLSPHAAAGIVGNLLQESSLNTGAIGDNGTSIGIAQWHNERGNNLKKFAAQRGRSWKDLNTQLEFLWKELNTSYSRVLSQLQNSQNVNQATDVFLEKFEIPKNPNASRAARRRFAQSLLS